MIPRSGTGRVIASLLVLLLAAGACQPAASPAPTSIPAPPSTPGTSNPVATTPAATTAAASAVPIGQLQFQTKTYPVPAGAHPHDVAPAADGVVWYTGQQNGTLGWLDPVTGTVREVDLGPGSAPHGVISGPDGAAWVTDQGLDAIVRVTPGTFEIETFRMPQGAQGEAVHTGVFDHDGVLWFTGQGGIVCRLDPATGIIEAFAAPRGAGPYGITVTPSNDIYVASLAGSYLGAVDRAAFEMRVLEPPTAGAGVRRAWSDSTGRVWISEWNAGKLGRYDPADGSWREWPLPGEAPMAYAIYVDDRDLVWVSDFGANALLMFDPATETFTPFPAES
ncbi:MAG: hypothetical protein ACAH65_12095, partial [Chloroflexota bacterium]